LNSNVWVEKVIKLYFEGRSVEEALKLTKCEKKKDELMRIAKKFNS
jgi:hypothetical protein